MRSVEVGRAAQQISQRPEPELQPHTRQKRLTRVDEDEHAVDPAVGAPALARPGELDQVVQAEAADERRELLQQGRVEQPNLGLEVADGRLRCEQERGLGCQQ